MSLQELQEQVRKLSVNDRLILINTLIQSIQRNLSPQSDRKTLINQMRGLLKTDQPSPTDEQVAALREEHLVEKYLK